MNDDQNPEPQGQNPWIKSLMIWGGVFLALLLVATMFGNSPARPASTRDG